MHLTPVKRCDDSTIRMQELLALCGSRLLASRTYIHMYIHLSRHQHVHVYIYIYIQREGEKDNA